MALNITEIILKTQKDRQLLQYISYRAQEWGQRMSRWRGGNINTDDVSPQSQNDGRARWE